MKSNLIELLDEAETALRISDQALEHAQFRLAVHCDPDSNVMERIGEALAFSQHMQKKINKRLEKEQEQ